MPVGMRNPRRLYIYGCALKPEKGAFRNRKSDERSLDSKVFIISYRNIKQKAVKAEQS